MDCWLRAKSDSSFSPASVKYLEKCSQLRLLAGKSSCRAQIHSSLYRKIKTKQLQKKFLKTYPFTISLLSMPTLRRLAATELMSFSLIHDLNSLTAKAADTPGQGHQDKLNLCCSLCTNCAGSNLKLTFWEDLKKLIFNVVLTLFDKVLIEEAAQDGGWYVAVGQQDAGQHG